MTAAPCSTRGDLRRALILLFRRGSMWSRDMGLGSDGDRCSVIGVRCSEWTEWTGWTGLVLGAIRLEDCFCGVVAGDAAYAAAGVGAGAAEVEAVDFGFGTGSAAEHLVGGDV